MHEDVQAIETLAQQTEKQLPGLKSSLENQFLKLRQTASSKSLFSLMTVKKNMAALIGETREILENYWLQKRRAVVLSNALLSFAASPRPRRPTFAPAPRRRWFASASPI